MDPLASTALVVGSALFFCVCMLAVVCFWRSFK